jgi:hypothetical protein
LMGQEVTIGFFASNREHRQGELGAGHPVRFRDRVCLIGGEVVPEMFELSPRAALHQRLRGGPVPVLNVVQVF